MTTFREAARMPLENKIAVVTGAARGLGRAIALKLASGDITDAMLERARRPVLDNGATREISNPWWIAMLDGSWAHPDQLSAAKTWEADYEGITLDEVKAEAKRWLAVDPLMVVASPGAAHSQAANTVAKPKG